MNNFLLIAAITLISTASVSQEVKRKIEAQAKNPKTKQNAAKADVLIIDKKQISDSSMVKEIPSGTTTTVYKPVAKKKKKSKKN